MGGDLSQAIASSRVASDGTKKKLPFKAPSRVDSSTSASMTPKPGAKPTIKTAAKKSVPAKATAATMPKASGFKPASKASAVAISSDEDSDELDGTPPKKKQRRKVVSDDEDGEEEEAEDELEADEAPARKQASRPKLDAAEPAIPQKLLTRLLYEGFEDKNMKIGKEAMTLVSKYMETFVREALARAVYEREEAEAEIGKGTGDGFLQVSYHLL